MPKLKTNKSAKKRLRVTKKKKILRSSSKRRHIMTDKTGDQKRSLRGKSGVQKCDKARLLKLMPYDA
jgi:large subunit ribosomal protein L35